MVDQWVCSDITGERIRMPRKHRIDEISIYLLFIVIFKPYFFPNIIQQALKCGIIIFLLIYIFFYRQHKERHNISILFCVSVILSSVINYARGLLPLGNVFNSILSAVCTYCIYTIIGINGTRNSDLVVTSLLRISIIYCVSLVLELPFPHSVESTGLVVYLWGNKFSCSYLFIFMLALLYIKYREKIARKLIWKTFYAFVILLSMLYVRIIECSTSYIAIGSLLIMVLLGDKFKSLLLKPHIILIALITAAAFPFVASAVMKIEFVNKFVVDRLGESANLSGRLALYDEYLLPVIIKSPIIGYGYGTTAMFDFTNFYGNTQNGLWDIIYRYGIVGALLFIMLTINCLRKSQNTSKTRAAVVFVYSIIIAGIVEVTYNSFFFFAISLVRWINQDKLNANLLVNRGKIS